MTEIRRCNAAERKAFRERYAADKARAGRFSRTATCPEPALGTLAERLDIIIQRQGGRTGPVKVGPAERRWLQGWGWAA